MAHFDFRYVGLFAIVQFCTGLANGTIHRCVTNLRHPASDLPNWDMVTIRVFVTLKPSLLDSAGRTVQQALGKLGYQEVEQVRIGKLIELQVDHYDKVRVAEMCSRLLANPVIEDYRIEEVRETVGV
jgi:phosphoribosylformylglycinamidine synthase PurS subunit